MSAELLSGTCPDCGSPITFRFCLLTNLGVGIMCYAKCDLCHFNGDPRSARLFVSVDVDTYRWAAKHDLYILLYPSQEEGEDEENIADELDDDEEYSRSNIGFKSNDDEED